MDRVGGGHCAAVEPLRLLGSGAEFTVLCAAADRLQGAARATSPSPSASVGAVLPSVAAAAAAAARLSPLHAETAAPAQCGRLLADRGGLLG